MEGFIKLYRKIIESPVFDNEKMLKIWIWCLCRASHKDKRILMGLKEVPIKKGQFVCGMVKASAELGIPRTTLVRNLRALEKLGMLTLQTGTKWTLVSIENWEKYQIADTESGHKTDRPRTDRGQTVDTIKNDKNDKNNNNIYYSSEIDEIVSAYNRLCPSLPTCTKVSDKRKASIKARLKGGYTVQDFEEVFRRAEESDFLSGRKTKWKAGIDWLINENNLIKVLEGNYNNAEHKGTTGPAGPDKPGDCDYSKFFTD